MLQSIGSQWVGHDLATEQHQPTLCSLNLSLAPPSHSFLHPTPPHPSLSCFFCCLCSCLVHYSLWKKSCFVPNFWSICRLHRCWFSWLLQSSSPTLLVLLLLLQKSFDVVFPYLNPECFLPDIVKKKHDL